MAANDRAQEEKEGEKKEVPEEAETDRGVKRSAEEQAEAEKVAKEEAEALALMREIPEQGATDDDVQVEENPMKKSLQHFRSFVSQWFQRTEVMGNPGSSGSAVYRFSPERSRYEAIALHALMDFRGKLTDEGA
ncbi:Hypothetical protein SCF082_LOCUS23763 [Durusdinium trenchii]|uniref:Uncharacterized protein n=1 Tax=Durusdinium trenchii TaxID=1381693 RepID=A0ABP0LPB3_9DINO